MIQLHIPAVPPGPNGPRGMLRSHWTRRRKVWRKWAMLVRIGMANQAIWGDAHYNRRCQVGIHQARKRVMDQDNLVASCKVVLDVLKCNGLIKDDSPKWCNLVVTQEVRRECYTLIVLEYS